MTAAGGFLLASATGGAHPTKSPRLHPAFAMNVPKGFVFSTLLGLAAVACSDSVGPPPVPRPVQLEPGPALGLLAAGGDSYEPNRGGHSCGLTPAGGAMCWGWNWNGQLGDGWRGDSSVPVVVEGGLSLRSITSDGMHVCGLDVDGGVHCWGDNNSGQLGSHPGHCAGARACTGTPVRVPLTQRASLVQAGVTFTCAATEDGQVVCWGTGYIDTNGTGEQAARATRPVPVFQPGPVDDLAAGTVHACALVQSEAYCWGSNRNGQLGTTTGRCDRWPYYGACSREPVKVEAPEPFVALAAGSHHSCGLSADGTAYCWGGNGDGQLGHSASGGRVLPVSGATRFARIYASYERTCALSLEGAAYCWGRNDFGQAGSEQASRLPRPTRVEGGHSFLELAMTWGHTCGLRTDGLVLCWGARHKGALGDGRTAVAREPVPAALRGRPVRSLALAFQRACLATVEGDAFCWGETSRGSHSQAAPVGNVTPLVEVSTGGHHACGLAPNGAAFCWGQNSRGQLGTGGLSDDPNPRAVVGGLAFTSLSVGREHTCGVTRNGEGFCWGSNLHGELGTGTPMQFSPRPIRVEGVPWLESVHAGNAMTCGRSLDGGAWCWGANGRGQLGLGYPSDRGSGRVGDVVFRTLSVARPRLAMHAATCGLDLDGVAHCWGSNEANKLGEGPPGSLPSPTVTAPGLFFSDIAVGDHSTCGITANGALYCWGRDPAGDVSGVVPAASPIPRLLDDTHRYVRVSVGRDVGCALTDRLAVRCWGDRDSGLVADGVQSLSAIPVLVDGGIRFGPR